MKTYDDILKIAPYALNRNEKNQLIIKRLRILTEHHLKYCKYYYNILKTIYSKNNQIEKIEQIPFIPVQLFKELALKSISEDEIIKVMTSSGTTGQRVSKIYLDRETAANQQKTLIKIVSETIGKSRVPMLIIDTPNVLENKRIFSARGAAILGFSMLASDKEYALDEDMNLNHAKIDFFLKKHHGKTIFIFGFTFMVWQYLKNIKMNLGNGILIHGGGWKKMKNEAASPMLFRETLKKNLGILRIHDYYGMVEQTGCIYMECENGYFHASIFSDVIIRRQSDFSVCDFNEQGIIQVLSLLPKSYPGHSILTEDEGILIGEDNCSCGRLGKYFVVKGRLKNAEVGGCSDADERR